MNRFLYFIALLFLFSCNSQNKNEVSHDICYNSNISLTNYYYHVGKIDSSHLFLQNALGQNELIPQDYLIALKIYLSKNIRNKATPLLRLMIHYGYKYESLNKEEEVLEFFAQNTNLANSLKAQSIERKEFLAKLPISIIVDSLFNADQDNRRVNFGNNKQTFISVEESIRMELVQTILQDYGVPTIQEIGFRTHGKLFTLLLHNFYNSKDTYDINNMITESYENRKYSCLEYGMMIDRKSIIETGYSKYAIAGEFDENSNYTFGFSVKEIDKLDSIRYFSLGLTSLKNQAEMSGAQIPNNYKPHQYICKLEPKKLSSSKDTIFIPTN